jgi:hypothetical protein
MIARPAIGGDGGKAMPLHAPSKIVFWIALVLVLLAVISFFVTIPFVTQFQFWLAVLGYVVLALGCVL